MLRVGASTVTVNAQPGISSSAEANVRVLAVSAFGGEIVAQSITVRAGGAAGPAGATGDVGSSSITGLVVLGQSITPTGNIQIPLADWGTLDVLGTSSSSSDAPRSAESAVTGLRIRLIAEHAGLPAGAELVVGSATASAVAQPAPATPPPPPRPAAGGPPGKSAGSRSPDGGPPARAPRRTRRVSRAA